MPQTVLDGNTATGATGVKRKFRQVSVRRWSIVSQKSFESVVASVEAEIGRPDMSGFRSRLKAASTYEELEDVVRQAISPIGFMEFFRIDAGAVLAKAGVSGNPQSVRLIIGNPLIMQSLARLVPDAVSYAPLTILIDRRADGVHLTYDEMSSYLAPYENIEALQIAQDLDVKVKRLLHKAS
ncbi:MAG TPA: DUF302 domain-containing protein [Bryobacteraceae bacterium]|nr:DUF302 domain-containing protein [Bryobacteraceae bacterium]